MKPPKAQAAKPTICFRAKLLRTAVSEKAECWTLTLPKSVSARLPSRGTTIVEGTINAFPFRAALETNGKGSHSLVVNKTMHDGAGGNDDDTDVVTVEIARVGDEPELRMPADLRKALAAAPMARAGWDDITPMARRDWIFSVTTAKQPETRKRRVEKACDMLACGKRRLCCFPGLKWVMRDNEKSCGMWLPLPKPETSPSPKSRR